MNKITTIFILIISFNVVANEMLVCPDGAKEVTGNRIYKDKKTTARGCVDKEGNLHGISLIIYKNTIIDRCNYINGQQHGKCESWYFTGEKKATTNFKNGKVHGKTIHWHKNGTIEFQATHDNGELINVTNN